MLKQMQNTVYKRMLLTKQRMSSNLALPRGWGAADLFWASHRLKPKAASIFSTETTSASPSLGKGVAGVANKATI